MFRDPPQRNLGRLRRCGPPVGSRRGIWPIMRKRKECYGTSYDGEGECQKAVSRCPLYRKTPLASTTLRLRYLSTTRPSSLRLWPAMAAISGTVQPAPAIRVTHVSSAVMDGQTRDASLDRFPMEHPAKAVRFPRFAVALQGLPSGKGAARMGPTFPQSIIRCYFHPSLPAQRSIRWCFAITNMGAGPRLTGRFLRAERRPHSS